MAQNYLYGVNLGEAMQAGQAIRKNNLLLESAEKEAAMQPQVNQFRQQAAAGDQESMHWLLANDPKFGEFVQAYSALGNEQRAKSKEKIEEIGTTLFLFSTKLDGVATPDQKQAIWERFRANASPEVQKDMPERYDPAYVATRLARAKGMKAYTENPQAIDIGGGQTQLWRGGEPMSQPVQSTNMIAKQEDRAFEADQKEKDRQNRIAVAGMGEGGTGRLKSTDEALIYRQAAGLFGGTFDQAGNLIALDASARPKVQAISTEAAKLFASGKYSRSESVTIAARKYGVNVGGGAQKPGSPAAGKTVKPFM